MTVTEAAEALVATLDASDRAALADQKYGPTRISVDSSALAALLAAVQADQGLANA